MDDGVRTKLINLRNGNWVIQGCEGGEAAALDWLKNNNGKQYDFGGDGGRSSAGFESVRLTN